MSTRTSIEIRPDRSRLLELTVARVGSSAATLVRVSTFAQNLPGTDDPPALETALRTLRRDRRLARDAAVTVWGLAPLHRCVRLQDAGGSDPELRAREEIAADLALLEERDGPATVVVSRGEEVLEDGASRREMWVVAAPAQVLDARLTPITGAGFRIVLAVTPALALLALSQRHAGTAAGAVAYVDLGAHTTAIAVVRRGTLLLSRELSWGFDGDIDADSPVPPRLGSELRRTLMYFRQSFRAPVESAVLCGELPALRSLTTPLGTMLGVPVQVLDSLAGIDGEHLPEPTETFRTAVASFRLALAAGSAPQGFPNLRRTDGSSARRRIAMVAAGACLGAAGLYVALAGVRLLGPVRGQPGGTEEVVAPAPPPGAPAETLPVESTRRAIPAAEGQSPRPSIDVMMILVSSERRLAVVDGRTVGVGDRVGPNVVFDIQPRAVIMESEDGTRWTVELREDLPAR